MISVIVPVYNAEKYLEACVGSILAQTCRELEVLLVNDGSSDGSLAVCRRLAEADGRVRVLDGPNGGVSAARNRGLEAAAGEYIAFVDSDDTILPDMYAALLAAAEAQQADVAECGIYFVPENGGEKTALSLGSRTAESREECLRQFAFFENTAESPCNKLYRREAVGSVRFPAYAQAEDALFNLRVLLQCRRRVTIPDCLYDYLVREDSCVHRTRPGHERDAVLAWQEIDRILESVSPALGPAVRHKTVDVIQWQYLSALRSRPEHWRSVCRTLKRDYEAAYPRQFSAERPMTRRQKLGFRVFRLWPRLYFWFNYGRNETL